MKNLIILLFLSVLVAGCSSSSLNTIDFTADKKLEYALKLFHDEDYLDAVQEFQSIILQFPGNAVIDDAQYYLAQSRFERHEYIMAAYEFSKLIKQMPASEYVPTAQFMLADSYYELSPDYRLEQQYTGKAIQEFQAFIDFFPTNEKVKDAEKKIAELNIKKAHKEFNTATLYEDMHFYKAATEYYENVVEEYHDTPYAPMALYKKIKLLVDKEKNTEALIDSKRFIEKYPEDPNFNEIEELKTSLETKLSLFK